MKKTLSVMLLLVLALSLFFPTASVLAEAMRVEGAWYLNAVKIEGIEMSPADLGLDMLMMLEADGTVLIQVTNEEDETATWSQEGETITVTGDGEAIIFQLDGETLVTEDDEATMIFGREKMGSEAPVASPEGEE